MGLNEPGARYAGIPIERRLTLLYVLSGIVSSVAGIILVAHLGLAKSDLGTGYELEAITAVVLGGTSVFGGRGTILGSVLGLFFLSVLQDGMHLLAMPSEWTGMLTGVLLLAIVGIEQLRTGRHTSAQIDLRLSQRINKTLTSRAGMATAAVLLAILGSGAVFGFLQRSHQRGENANST